MKLEEAKRKIKEIYEISKPFKGVVFLPRQGAVKVDWGVEDPREFIRRVFAEGGFHKNLELKGKLKASEILNYIYDMAKLQSKQLIDAYYMNKYYEYIKEKDSNILKGLGYVAQYTLFETIPKALAQRTLGFSELIAYGLKKMGVDEFSDVYNYAMARKAELKLYNNAAEKFMADYITNKGFGGAVSVIMNLASFMYGYGTLASGVRKLGKVWASAYPEKFLGKVGRFLIAPEMKGVSVIKKALSEGLTFTAFDQIANYVSPYRYSLTELVKDTIWGHKPTGEQVFEGVAGFFTGLLWGAVPTISRAIDSGIRGIAVKYPRSYIVGLGARILNNPVSGAVLNELKNTPAFLVAEVGSQGISQATAEILKTLGYSIGPINVNLWEGIYGVGLMQLFNMGMAGALGLRYKKFRNQLLNELERAFGDIEQQMQQKGEVLQTEIPSATEGTKIGDVVQPHFDEFRKAVDNLQMARNVVFARTLKTNALLEIAQNYGLLDRVGIEPSKLDMPTALYIAHKELMKSFASIYQTLGYIYQKKPELLKDQNLGLPVIEGLRKGLEHITEEIERATGGKYRVIVQFDKQMKNGFVPLRNILVAQYDQGKLKMTEILNFGGFKGKIVEVDNNAESILSDIKKFANDFLKNYTVGEKSLLDLYYENTVSQLYKDLMEVFFNPFKVFFGNRRITAYKNQQNFLKLFNQFKGLIKPEDLVIKFNNLASKYNLPLIYSELGGDLGTYWEAKPVYAVFNLGGEPIAIPFVVLAGPDGKLFAQEGLRMLEKTGYVRFIDSGGFNPQVLVEGNLWGRELKREDVKSMQEMVRKMIQLPNDLNNLLGETSLSIFFNEFIKEKLGMPGFDIREIMKDGVGSKEVKKLQSAIESGEVDRVIEVLKEVADAAVYEQVKDNPELQKELAKVIVANSQTPTPPTQEGASVEPPKEVEKKPIEPPEVKPEPLKPEVILNLQARYNLLKQNLGKLSPSVVVSSYRDLLNEIAGYGNRPELNDLVLSAIKDLQDLKSEIQKGLVDRVSQAEGKAQEAKLKIEERKRKKFLDSLDGLMFYYAISFNEAKQNLRARQADNVRKVIDEVWKKVDEKYFKEEKKEADLKSLIQNYKQNLWRELMGKDLEDVERKISKWKQGEKVDANDILKLVQHSKYTNETGKNYVKKAEGLYHRLLEFVDEQSIVKKEEKRKKAQIDKRSEFRDKLWRLLSGKDPKSVLNVLKGIEGKIPPDELYSMIKKEAEDFDFKFKKLSDLKKIEKAWGSLKEQFKKYVEAGNFEKAIGILNDFVKSLKKSKFFSDENMSAISEIWNDLVAISQFANQKLSEIPQLKTIEKPNELNLIDNLISNFYLQLKAIGELNLKQQQVDLIEKLKQQEALRQSQLIIKYINDEFTFKRDVPNLLREYMALGYMMENEKVNAQEIAKLFNLDEKRAKELISGQKGKKSRDSIYVIRSNLKSEIMKLRDQFVEAFAKLYPHLDETERGLKMLEVIRSWGLSQKEIEELFRLFTDEKLNVKLGPDHDFVKFLNTPIKGTEFGSVDFGTVLSPTGEILYRREGVPAVLEAFPGEKTYQEISEHFKPREIKTVKDWVISSVWSVAEGLLQKVAATPEVKKEVYETLARIIDNLDTKGGYEDLLNYLNEVVRLRVKLGEIKKLIEPMEKISDDEFKKLKKEGKIPKNWSKEKWIMEKAKELEAIQPEDVMIYHITPLTRKKLSSELINAEKTKKKERRDVKLENIISKGIFFRDIYEKTAVSGQAGTASVLHKHTATIEDVISAILLKLWRNVDWTGAKREMSVEGLIVRTDEGEELNAFENLPAGPEAIPSFVFEKAVNHKGLANMIDKIYKNYKELNLGVFLSSFGRGVKEHLGIWGKSAEDIKMLGINLKNLNLEKITEENREMYEQLIDLFSGFVLAFPEPKGNMEKAFNMLSEALKGVVLDAQTSPGNFEAKAMLSMIDRFKNKFAQFLVKNSEYIESVFKQNRQDRYLILGRKLLEALDIKDYARSMKVVSDVLGILKTYIGSYSPTLAFFLVPELWLLLKEIWDWEVENAS
jgi:hypothetical protein